MIHPSYLLPRRSRLSEYREIDRWVVLDTPLVNIDKSFHFTSTSATSATAFLFTSIHYYLALTEGLIDGAIVDWFCHFCVTCRAKLNALASWWVRCCWSVRTFVHRLPPCPWCTNALLRSLQTDRSAQKYCKSWREVERALESEACVEWLTSRSFLSS